LVFQTQSILTSQGSGARLVEGKPAWRNTLVRFLIALCTVALAASAGPITWNLVGVTFVDGGTATGSFVFDADTGTYSSIDIVTTAGFGYPAETFTTVCTSPCKGETAGADDMLLLTSITSADFTGMPGLAIFTPLRDPLSDAGGVIELTGGTAYEALCANSTCEGPTGVARHVESGELDGVEISAVPEPSTAILFCSAALLLGLGRFRRWQRS
jgi:hypothetical protein